MRNNYSKNRRVAGITKQDIEIVTVRKVDMGGGWEFYATIHEQGGYAWHLFNPSGELDTIRLTNSIDRALGTAEAIVEHKLRSMSITDEEKEQLMRDNQNYLRGLKGGSRRANRKRANNELALVVFSQIGDDLFEEVVDDLDDGEYESVVDYMSQWDYGEYHDFESESYLESVGYVVDMGHYVLSYTHTRAPFVALYVKTGDRRANRKTARDLIEEVLYDAQDLVEDGTLRDEYDFYDEIADQTYQVLDTTPEEIAEIYEAMKDTGLVSGNATTPDKMVEELVDVVLDNVTYVPKSGSRRANRRRANQKFANEEHNGWTNYETWYIKAIIDNDYDLYQNTRHLNSTADLYSMMEGHPLNDLSVSKMDKVNWDEIFDAIDDEYTANRRANRKRASERMNYGDVYTVHSDGSITTENVGDHEWVNIVVYEEEMNNDYMYDWDVIEAELYEGVVSSTGGAEPVKVGFHGHFIPSMSGVDVDDLADLGPGEYRLCPVSLTVTNLDGDGFDDDNGFDYDVVVRY